MAALLKFPTSERDPGDVLDMELYQLRTFVTVAREGNLTRAAERLFTSQPTVSAHIKSLEEEFGLKLFERTASGMEVTPAGEALWEEAERVLGTVKDLTARAGMLKGRIAGTLRLGLNNDAGILRTTQLVTALGSAHPALRFDLCYATSGAVLQNVQSRDLDAGFFEGETDDPAIELVRLTELTLVVAIPQIWAAELERPDWRPLEQKPWVAVSPLCSHYELMRRLARERGLTLNARFTHDDDATALGLVAAGMAVCVTTVELLRAAPAFAGAVAEWPHFRHKMPLSLCYLKSRGDDPIVRALVSAAKDIWSRAQAAA